MGFSAEFGKGISAYAEANRVIFKYGLGKYLFIPGLVSILYAVGYFILAWRISLGMLKEAEEYPWWLNWMGPVTEWFVGVVFWGIAILLFWATYKYVVQVVLSPILSRLSEEVEHKVFGGEPPKTGLKEALSDIGRSLHISLRNLIREILLCFVAGWIPVVGGFLAFGISSYFAGFNFMDYTLERHRMNVPQTVAFVRKHRGLATGLGLVVQLGMMIPLFGWMLVPTYATVASTLEVYKITGNNVGVNAIR